MGYDNRHRFVSGLAAGGLFTLVLLVSLHGASRMAHGDPGALFVRADGSGTLCPQAQPCTLQTALSQAAFGDTLHLAGSLYTGMRNHTEGRGG